MTLSAIAQYLRTKSGLDEASLGSGVLERAVRRRLVELQAPNVEAYYRRLVVAPDELQALVNDITIPETSFFRDPGVFEALTGTIAADWIGRSSSRTLRILSIPCSTGEEPYSIAMALLDAGVPADRFSVDAVDISSRVLVAARRAVYTGGSFRGRDLGYRARHFHRTAHGWELDSQVRECVRFRHGNLLDPQLSSHTYDVVFCRNLLIYFDAEMQSQAMGRLDALVATGGLLFLGPAETFLTRQTAFESLGRPMSFGFRKAETRSVPAPSRPARPRAPRRPPPVASAPAVGTRARSKPHFTAAPPASRAEQSSSAGQSSSPEQSSSADLLDRAEVLANSGRLSEAADLCRASIEREGPSARACFLLGVASDALGDEQAALAYFRKAVYLQPDHEQALLHLALLTRQRGATERAGHLARRARSLGRATGEE